MFEFYRVLTDLYSLTIVTVCASTCSCDLIIITVS